MIRTAVVGALRLYKRFISPALPPACRFTPTCSEFAAEAVQKHGVLRGGTMAMLRLVRCGPWHPGGYHPVPLRPAQLEPRSATVPSDPIREPPSARHRPRKAP